MKKTYFATILAWAVLIQMSHAQVSERKVFAHYMVCCPTYGATLNGMKQEIQDAQAAGIDGFALNCGDWLNNNYKARSQLMYDAVEQLGTGFKLFFSADMCCNNSALDVQDMVKSFGNRSAQYKYNNRIVLSTFAGDDKGSAFWVDQVLTPLRTSGYDVFFMPFFYTNPVREMPDSATIRSSYEAWWKNVDDGMFFFGAAGTPTQVTASAEAYAKVGKAVNKPIMAPVSPSYWGRVQTSGGRRYYEYQGGEGIEYQWNSVIQTQKPQWVEIVTWNDPNESYICPAVSDSQMHYYVDPVPRGYIKQHIGYLELCKYFINWYKTDVKPAITSNAVYYFYRTHPKSAVASSDPLGAVTSLNGVVDDAMYLTAIAKDTLDVRVTTGSTQQTIRMLPGISHARVPFAVGQQRIEIIRKGVTLATKTGEQIVSSITNYNFYSFTDFVSVAASTHSQSINRTLSIAKGELPIEVSIVNLKGQTVFVAPVSAHRIALFDARASHLSNGIYTMRIKTGRRTFAGALPVIDQND